MKHKLLRRLGALALAVVLALSTAVTPAMAAGEVTGITLSEPILYMTKGDRMTLTATAQPSGDTVKVAAASSDSSIVVGKQNGEIVAMAVGRATITATYTVNGESFTDTCEVIVEEAVESITLRPGSEFKLNVGEMQTLIPLLKPEGVTANLTWTTDNPAAATVKEENGNGVVTAVGAGTATITVTADNGVSAECKFTVETVAPTKISLPSTLTVVVGGTETLTPTLEPAGADKNLKWTYSPSTSYTSYVTVDEEKGEVTGVKKGTVTITVTAVDENGNPIKVGNKVVSANCTVSVRDYTAATSVTLTPTSLQLNPGSDNTAQLKATVLPTNSTDKVWWESSNKKVAEVDPNGLVTAVEPGTAIITVYAGNESAQCKVTVGPAPTRFTFAGVNNSNELTLTYIKRGDTNRVKVNPVPSNSVFTYAGVTWSVVNGSGVPDQSVIRVVKDPASVDVNGCSAVVTVVGPGEATLVVTSGEAEGRCTVEIPGITLRGNVLQIQNDSLSLKEGDVEQLIVDPWGSAKNLVSNILWESSDSSVVDVYNGRITARTPGTVKITAILEGYEPAQVTVTVQEDTSALIQGGSVTAGGSLNLSTVASQLNSIALSKTGSTLSYIANLSVATSQGILHDTHRSEADTGAGVGIADRYYLSANTVLGQSPLSDLSFVAKNTFSGTADISYTGVTTDNQSFTGIIRVTVGAASDVWYSAIVGQPLSFQSDDFNRICQNKQGGRSLNYVTFTLPQSSWGQLYYDYNGPTHPGQTVTSGTQYYRTRTPSLDRISFVPSSTCPSSVAIAYRATDNNGGTYSGVVTINVTKQSGGNGTADVTFNGLRGEKVPFSASAFNAACVNTIGETLSYVRFSLPAASEGVMYLNYWGVGSYSGTVNANTSYYYSGTPSLGTISFVSASMASGQVAIPYTGYGARGTVYTGTVYINLDDADQSGTRYSVTSGKTVYFNLADFNNACINATGASLNYVRFGSVPTSAQGYLRYHYISGSNYGTVSTSTQCYRTNPSSSSWTALIGNVYFQANTSYVGTVTLPYTGYNTNGVSFTGEVVIQVTPNTITYTGTNASPLQVSASQVSNACNGLMNRPLSYITLNNLPASSTGHLYVGYTKVGTGTAANTGTRYYVSGSPNIGQLSFVPRGRYEGQVTVGYTAVSTSGEQVTGQIVFNITPATSSRYFIDMGGHVWAASAADYLRLNGISNGFGGNTTFGPAQKVMRRDFMVMLGRAFQLPSAGSYSFSDVPTNAYYSQALASAKQLGIVSASDNRFRPSEGLTREDAMVMVYNTLVAMGKNPPNGSEADLSRFTDNASVSSSARSAVASLVRMGVIRGSNGQLSPKETITRAESAIILHYVLTM